MISGNDSIVANRIVGEITNRAGTRVISSQVFAAAIIGPHLGAFSNPNPDRDMTISSTVRPGELSNVLVVNNIVVAGYF